MDTQTFLDIVPDLTDLELAVLLSLIAQQHCLISTEQDSLEDLSAELALIVSEVFGLSYSVLSADDLVSVEQFGASIVDQEPTQHSNGLNAENGESTGMNHTRLASVSVRANPYSDQTDLDQRTVVNVIIAKDFNHATQDVQIAALELIERRRIFSRTTVHPVPRTFLFIPLLSVLATGPLLNHHLNDRLYISHYHDAEDGFAKLETVDMVTTSGPRPPTQSAYKQKSGLPNFGPRIDDSLIDRLRAMGDTISMTSEVRRYIQDLVVFLRMERGVDGGVTASATTMLVMLSKHLAALHAIDYVTPSLVELATRKIYPHRIKIAGPERERSMQYGSDIDAVKALLAELTAHDIIENVLASVPCPL